MGNNDFSILLNAVINKSGITTELKQVQQIVNKYSIDIMPELKTASLRNQMKSVSKNIANDFNKTFGTNLTGNDVFKAFENQAKQATKSINDQKKAIEEVAKAQELYNAKVKEGKALASKQASDASLSKQKSLYDEIASNQKQVYSLKQKLISSDTLETQELNEQIGLLEKRNKYLNYKINKSDLSSNSYEKELVASKQVYENELKIKETRSSDKSINKNTEELKKQATQLENNRKLALDYTKSAQKLLQSAVTKNSYGDNTSAIALQKQLGNGVINFKDLNNVSSEIDNYKAKVEGVINALELSHKSNLNIINDEISKEAKLASDTKEAYQINEEFDKNKKKMYLDESSAYKTNESLRQKAIADEKKLYTATEQAYKINQKSSQDSSNLKSSKIVMNNQVSSYLRENSKLTDDFKNRLISLQQQLKTADKTQLNKLKNEFKEITSEARSMGVAGKSAFDQFKGNISQFLNFFYGAGAVVTAIDSVKKLITTTVELDKVTVDLQMATGKSNEETKKLLNTYIDMGQQLGATGVEVANAASSYLKQGKSLAETNILIKDSIMLSKLGSIESADATKYLTTITKAYGITAENTLSVVDKLSKVDLISATDVGGLASGLNEVSSNAQSLGVNIDELLGYVAAIGEVSGEQMSAVGNSVNTMFSRMGNIKLKRLVDPTTGEDLSNTETSLRRVGIALRDDNETFRDFSDVLTEVAGNWSGYNDVTKQSIAASIAGVDHINDFKILMSAFGKATEYTNASMNSSGTAMEKFSAYEEGVESKTKKLQASLQELSAKTLNSQVIKSFLDFSNVLVNVISSAGGLVPVIITLGTAFAVHKLLLPLIVKEMSALLLAETGVTATTLSQIVAQTGLNGAIALGTTAIRTNTVAIATWMATNPVGWLMLLGVGIAGAVTAYDAFNVSLEEHRKKIEELSESYETTKSEIKSLQDELTTTGDRIDELNGKENLTFTEKGELEKLKETNKELKNRLILLQKEAEIKSADLNKEIESTFKSDFKNGDEYSYNTGLARHDGSYSGEWVQKDEEKYFRNQVADAEKLIALGDKRTKQQDTQLKNIQKYTSEVGNRISKDTKSYVVFDEQTKKQKAKWEEMIDLAAKVSDPSAYKTASFDEIFNSDTFSKSKKELVELAKAGTLTSETISSNKEYQQLLNGTGLKAKDVAEQIYALSTSNDKVANAAEKASSALSSVFTEEQSKSIDDYQSSLKTIQSALSDTASLSYSDIMDLMQQFSDFDWGSFGVTGVKGVGDLSSALSVLSNHLYNNLGEIGKSNSAYKSMSDEAITASMGVKDLEVVTDAANKKTALNSTQVKYLKGQYSGLAGQLVKTKNGWYLESGAIDTVKTAILKLKTDYITAVQSMTTMVESGTTKRLNSLGVDLAGIKTASEAYYMLNASMANNTNHGAQEAKTGYEGFIKNWYKTKKEINKLLKEGMDGNTSPSGNDLGKEKPSSTDDKYLKSVQAQVDALKHKLAMGEISESTYYNKLDKINDKYFKGKKKYLSEYNQYEEEIYSGREKLESAAAEKSKQIAEESATNKENGIKSMFDSLKDSRDMDEISDEEYYKTLSQYNDAYYKKDKDFQNEYKANLIELHNWEIEQAEKTQQAKFDAYDETIEKIDTTISEAKRLEGLTKDGSNEQLVLVQVQLSQTKNKISSLKNEIKSLNNEYAKNKDSETYKSRLKDLNSELESAIDDMLSYNSAIADSIKSKYENEVDALNKLSDAYKDTIEAARNLLNEQKKADDYNDSINEKTDDINAVQKRITELTKAAESGDREAMSEKEKLEEDLADKKKDLAKTQKDHEIDMALDALDKAENAYDKTNKAKIDAIENLYDKESELIRQAASLSETSFKTALDNINAYAKSNGLTVSDSLSNAMTNTYPSVSSQSVPSGTTNIVGNQTTSSVSNRDFANQDAVLSILQHGSGTGAGNSELNQWVKSKFGGQLSYSQMSALASIYGINGVTADSIKSDTATKNLILSKLKSLFGDSTFSTGGLARSLGEDKFIAVKDKELILNQTDSKTFQDFVPAMRNMYNNILKPTTPNLSSVVTNNKNLSPTINVNLPSGTVIDKSAINDWKQFVPQMTDAISKELLNAQRQYR